MSGCIVVSNSYSLGTTGSAISATALNAGANAIEGGANSGAGVLGYSGYSGTGVVGSSSSGTGVLGISAGGSAYGIVAKNTAANAVALKADATTSSGGTAIVALGSVTAMCAQGDLYVDQGTYYSTGSQTSISHYSDVRLKKNIKALDGALEQLLRLRWVTYEWKDPAEHGNEQGVHRGFIAQ